LATSSTPREATSDAAGDGATVNEAASCSSGAIHINRPQAWRLERGRVGIGVDCLIGRRRQNLPAAAAAALSLFVPASFLFPYTTRGGVGRRGGRVITSCPWQRCQTILAGAR